MTDDHTPTSFLDFLQDDCALPLLIYKTSELPKCTILEQGSEKGVFPCTYCCMEWDWDSEFMLVLNEDTIDYDIPERWLNKLERTSFDWIRVPKESIKPMMAAKDPYMIVWEYSKGPRAWCQHGGDEDWTIVIKTATQENDWHKQIINISLSNWDHTSDEGDFTVITAAHA